MDLTDKEIRIAGYFASIMLELGLSLSDPGQMDTPNRVAKMYVRELCSGLDEKNAPCLTVFPNQGQFDQIVLVDNVSLVSLCQHHFLPFVGVCHIAYLPSATGNILGLSKFNRLVQHLSSKPHVQEALTQEIFNDLKKVLDTEDVAVIIKAKHLCCAVRGVRDAGSQTTTSCLGGKFRSEMSVKDEFFQLLKLKKRPANGYCNAR